LKCHSLAKVRFLSLEDKAVTVVVEDAGYGVDPIPLLGMGAISRLACWRRRNLLGDVISYRPVVNLRGRVGILQEAKYRCSWASWNTARSQMQMSRKGVFIVNLP
jgi:hypothetical protein